MVSMGAATLDLVTHDDAQPAFPAVHLEGQTVLSYGELAELVGEAERVLRHDSKALVLCAGDRDLPTLLAYLAALRLGHAVAFLPASDEILSSYQPEFVIPAPGEGAGLTGLGYRPAAEPIAGTTIFQRESSQPAGELYPDLALMLGTSGSTGSPKTVRLSYTGLAGNIAAVIRALGITAAERGPTSLPITHAYGLSVLNTHLLAGASVVFCRR
jgi:non-ribosomal peptide synthetase component F